MVKKTHTRICTAHQSTVQKTFLKNAKYCITTIKRLAMTRQQVNTILYISCDGSMKLTLYTAFPISSLSSFACSARINAIFLLFKKYKFWFLQISVQDSVVYAIIVDLHLIRLENDKGCICHSLYFQGCLDKLTEEVKDNLSYILGTAIGLAVLQVSVKYH